MALLHRDRTDHTAGDAGDLRDTDRPGGPEHVAPVLGRDGVGSRDRDDPVVVRKNSFGQTLRTMLATILLVGVVAIAAANPDQVDVDLLFEQYDFPVAAIVATAAAAGFLIGTLLAMGRRRVG